MRRRIVMISILGVILGAFWPSAPATAGGGCHDPQFGDEKTDEIKMGNLCFYPTVARVEPGTQVTWRNGDPVTHMATGAGGAWGSADEVASNGRTTFTFDEPGVFPYSCPIHPGMVGAVVVNDGVASATAGTGVTEGMLVDGTARDAGSSSTGAQEDGWGRLRLLAVAAGIAVAVGLWAVSRRRAEAASPDPAGGAAV